MAWLGLDIGGANIKCATAGGFAQSRAFPLWQERRRLPETLASMFSKIESDGVAYDGVVLTMTGELADCYADKAEGVAHILESVSRAVLGRRILVYLTDGRFVGLEEARQEAYLAAASNWRALSQFVARFSAGRPAVLVDIGSTTTDIIPIAHGRPATTSRTDTNRLQRGELIYTGVSRTPVCAVLQQTNYRGGRCPLAKEWFATMHDVYLVLEDLRENPLARDTADGRPQTMAASVARLGRALCADQREFDLRDARTLARTAAVAQQEELLQALRQVVSGQANFQMAVLSGEGEFLADRLIQQAQRAGMLPPDLAIVSLKDKIGEAESRCAPAHALAVLAEEQFPLP